jgi:hypothetical protein
MKLDSARSSVRVAVSRALAEALILGIDECNENDRPLSQLQQIDLATMSIMCYDNATKICETMDVFEILDSIARGSND